jgi:threonine synthase
MWKSHGYPDNVAQLWSNYMWPWETTPISFADGILDDETYDWIPVLRGVHESGGSGVPASEDNVVRAHELAHLHTDIDVSPTGSAGLAGLLQIRDEVSSDDSVLVIFSGHSR